jgi:hypothetical protein
MKKCRPKKKFAPKIELASSEDEILVPKIELASSEDEIQMIMCRPKKEFTPKKENASKDSPTSSDEKPKPRPKK